MKKLITTFITTFIITLISQIAYDYNKVIIDNYIKDQIKQAKLMNIVVKYNIKPEGLEA